MKILNRVGITGLGCVCAAGADLESCTKFMEKGERHPAPPLRFSSAISSVHPVFEVPDSFLISKNLKYLLNPEQSFLPSQLWNRLLKMQV